MATEVARYWQHAAVEGVDLLRARYVTHRYGRHSHETYTFGLIEAGVEEFDYGSSVLRAGPGAVALLNPDVVHTGHAATPAGWTYRVLYPQVSVVTEIAAELGWRQGTPRFPETVLYDQRTAGLLRSAHQAAEHGDQLASATLLIRALAGLLRAHATVGVGSARSAGRAGASGAAGSGVSTRTAGTGILIGAAGLGDAPRAPSAVGVVRDLLAERLTQPPSLAELAALTGLSQFSLLRAFRTATGLPPHAYLNQLRVRRARLLLDNGLPPADVAAATGFADQAHLTRHFKRVVGVPPASYQRERLQRAG
jgi:AraC-like DNA-binding protein